MKGCQKSVIVCYVAISVWDFDFYQSVEGLQFIPHSRE